VSVATVTAVAVVLLLAGPKVVAQERGPTVDAARAAFVAPSVGGRPQAVELDTSAQCGSHMKNAALLGLGLSLATAMIELTYTIVREPFVRNGHDWPGADPKLIAWTGGAGFVVGLIGTERCRRRSR
jgi:hypothetical protein